MQTFEFSETSKYVIEKKCRHPFFGFALYYFSTRTQIQNIASITIFPFLEIPKNWLLYENSETLRKLANCVRKKSYREILAFKSRLGVLMVKHPGKSQIDNFSYLNCH